MGDILKMRFLRSLKLPTCRMTDIASITKMPPKMTSNNSCLVQIAAVQQRVDVKRDSLRVEEEAVDEATA